jgi:hypothetical protein
MCVCVCVCVCVYVCMYVCMHVYTYACIYIYIYIYIYLWAFVSVFDYCMCLETSCIYTLTNRNYTNRCMPPCMRTPKYIYTHTIAESYLGDCRFGSTHMHDRNIWSPRAIHTPRRCVRASRAWSVCVCVCVCVCVQTRCVHLWVCVSSIYTCMHGSCTLPRAACKLLELVLCACMCMHTQTRVSIYIYIYIYTHTHIACVYIHVCMGHPHSQELAKQDLHAYMHVLHVCTYSAWYMNIQYIHTHMNHVHYACT